MRGKSLIAVSDPERALARDRFDVPGGFAWWYADMVDGAGNGLVAIWSFGLPFLPGHLSGARRGQAARPSARPCLNVVIYRARRPSFYLLQEYEAGDAEWDGDRWRFGRSRIESVVHRGLRRTHLALDCDVPGADRRLTGEVHLEGPVPRLETAPGDGDGALHLWSPLVGPARCRADLSFGSKPELSTEGLAYHDRNAGSAPLDQLGIGEWVWGRRVRRQATEVFYILWGAAGDQPPEAHLLKINADGRVHLDSDVEVALTPRRRTLFGMTHAPRLELQGARGGSLRADSQALVDVGPFYLRAFGSLSGGGSGGGPGILEWVRPDRIDLLRHRAMVRMRVHRAGASNSICLPLFSGPVAGRFGRMLRYAAAMGRG